MADWHANIDLVFRNGLKNHEVLPPEDVWENISRSIPVKKRRIYPVLMRAAVYAALVISTGAAVYILNNEITGNLSDLPALTLNQEAMPEGAYMPAAQKAGTDIPQRQPAVLIPDVTAAKDKSRPKESNAEHTEIQAAIIAENNIFSPAGDGLYLVKLKSGYSDLQENLRSKIFDITYSQEERIKDEGEKWKMGASVLPSYYSRFNFSSNDAAADFLKSEKTAYSYSGGLSLNYEVSRRISLMTGIFYSAVGQRIDGITSFTGFSKYNESKSESDFSILTSSGTISSTNKDIYFLDNSGVTRVQTRYSADVFDPMKANLSHLSNSLIQSMSYLEIPLMMKYKLIDRKIDFSMLGGLSYGILIGNASYINSGGTRYTIGHTSGLSPVTFSSSVGMGMEYKLTNSLTFNIEPILRYYITPLGGITGSMIHPYSFGILSGIFYNF